MTETRVAEGLAELPPGPGLSAALAGVDLDAVGARDAVAVLRAWSRQRAHVDARMQRAVLAVARCAREASRQEAAAAGVRGRPDVVPGEWTWCGDRGGVDLDRDQGRERGGFRADVV